MIAIDPGPLKSAFVEYENGKILTKGIVTNEILEKNLIVQNLSDRKTPVVIEWISNYGSTVGQSVFHTCRWIGRFEACHDNVRLISRRDIKHVLCGTLTAKDKDIREALIDHFGPIGTKKKPGPLYGFTSHLFSALAVAVAFECGAPCVETETKHAEEHQ
jgi:hypothetical protein